VNWTAIASVLLALGVMLGAFGAHALRSRLDAYLLGIYERAVFYHFIHALGMLIVSVLPKAGLLPVNSMAWAWACAVAAHAMTEPQCRRFASTFQPI